jgi:hypothetical protein
MVMAASDFALPSTRRRSAGFAGLFSILAAIIALAGVTASDAATFDLAGPKLEVRVTHGGITLPIGQTPNLSPGDKIWIKANLPPGQSVRYLLVAGFLRGATNPPPKDWFTASETWTAKGAAGLQIVVPPGAQRALLFLAPSTGGDFDTITGAVRQRPGVFERASQALNQAALDHSRLAVYLGAVERAAPDQLKAVSPILASSLGIKLDTDCLKKVLGAQAACLTQDQDSLVLNDGHSISMVQSLTSGNTADLIQQLSFTPKAGSGYYSPYLSSVLDIARALDSFRTAQFQYIPTLWEAQGEQLSLLLNSPPSFQNPKSVLVIALPVVELPQPPPLHPVDADQAYCLRKPGLVLPVQGAPLIFSTGFAHDLVLHIGVGRGVDLPVLADAEKGGFTLDLAALDAAHASAAAAASEGQIRGRWGFDPYEGPRFKLQASQAGPWTREGAGDLVQGANQTVLLNGPAAACVSGVTMAGGAAAPWRVIAPRRIEVTLPLKDARPGPLTLQVQQDGLAQPDPVTLQVYAEPSRLDNVVFNAGDSQARIVGDRLDQIASLELGGAVFRPGPGSLAPGGRSLTLAAADPAAAGLLAAGPVQAKAVLKDGRGLNLAVVAVAASRPRIDLIAKNAVLPAPPGAVSIDLVSPDDAPHTAQLTFSIRAAAPIALTDKDRIEVRAERSGATTTLVSGSGLTLQDSSVAVAELDLAKAFDASTFGPLQFRLVQGEVASDWRPLAVLVRLPILSSLKCAAACQLEGRNLFLIDAVSADASFGQSMATPPGFTGQALPVPHPVEGRLYVRLRDDPAVADTVAIPTGRKRAAAPPSDQ